MGEFTGALALMDGTCETGAILGWRLMREELPGVRFVVVQRDPREVLRSLAQHGWDPHLIAEEISQRALMLQHVARLPGALSFQYPQLSDPLVARAIFEFCLEAPFDLGWWERLEATNIQVDMGSRIQRLAENAPRIAAFRHEVMMRSAKLEAPPCMN